MLENAVMGGVGVSKTVDAEARGVSVSTTVSVGGVGNSVSIVSASSGCS